MEPYRPNSIPGLQGVDKVGENFNSNNAASTPVSATAGNIFSVSPAAAQPLLETRFTTSEENLSSTARTGIEIIGKGTLVEENDGSIYQEAFVAVQEAYVAAKKGHLMFDAEELIETIQKHSEWLCREDVSELVSRLRFLLNSLKSYTNEQREISLISRLENTIESIQFVIFQYYAVSL